MIDPPTFRPGSARDLVKEGSWFKDPEGRFALLRGVNFSARSKLPPYLPVMPLHVRDLDAAAFHTELASVRPQLDLMKQLGFNVVRLPIMWKALEPRPNPELTQLLPEGIRYLELVGEVIDALWERGLYVIVDFHQDIAHEAYNGDGFPDWALAIDASHGRPDKTSVRNPRWGLHYYDTVFTLHHRQVRHTLQSFWKNDLFNEELSPEDQDLARPVRTHLEKTIGCTARFFQSLNNGRGHPAILGYEPFNEPHPVGIPRRDFEAECLPRYYGNVLREVRRAGDKQAFLFLEPRMDWTTYNLNGPEFHETQFTLEPESLLDLTALHDERLVFSFHHYDPWTLAKAAEPSPFYPYIAHGDDMAKKEKEWPDVFRRLKEAATSRGLIPFLGEFGGSQDWLFGTNHRPLISHGRQIRAYMDLQFRQVEALLLNATYWNFDLYNTKEGKDNWNRENFSLLGPDRTGRNLDIVARPYPMRSSAEPMMLWFDLETKQAAVILNGPVVAAPTVVFVPGEVHYTNGFEVRTTSPEVQWDQAHQLLSWSPDARQSRHQLVICPRGMLRPEVLPELVREQLPATTFQTMFGPEG